MVRNGDICESIGTTDVLTACIDKPVFGHEFINRCHAVKGLWIYQGAMSNTGTSLSWCLHTLCRDLLLQAARTEERPMHLMDLEAERSCPGANGIVFLPYLAGERSPIWDSQATGVFYGLTQKARREDLVRAVMESSCYGMRQLLELCEGLTRRRYDSIDLIGGGAKSLIWSQMKADITGKTVQILENNNASVIGAAILAGVGVGIFQSVEEANDQMEHKASHILEPQASPAAADIYENRFQTYIALYQQIKPIFSVYN